MLTARSYLADMIIAAVMIVLSIWFFILSLQLPLNFGGGDFGAAAFPLLVTILAFFLSVMLLISAWKKRAEDVNDKIEFKQPLKLISVAGTLILYILLIPIIGYYISSAIFFPLLLLLAKERNWIKIVFVTAGFLLFSWGAFDLALGVPLP
ncbi:tripartite tricarboxylate transporter TctB family protein [Bacillus daqingensis]|uniref:Tripartite tricarboxylate transporter TctB family protein n=1 Tax=Bacillus daqingensis TaxID=872396 RepID=A0ABV9NTZ7_9BACI